MRNIRLKKGPYSQPEFSLKKKSYSSRGYINRTADTINNDLVEYPSTTLPHKVLNYREF